MQFYDRVTPVVKNLIIANVVVYVLTFVFNRTGGLPMEDFLALFPFQSDKFLPHQFVSSMFMHSQGNLMHIVFNMLTLFMLGPLLESMWGSKKFLTCYMVAGIGAGVLHNVIQYYEIEPARLALEQLLSDPTPINQFDFLTAISNAIPNFPIPDEDFVDLEGSKGLYQSLVSIPTIGASGAVFGIMAAFAIKFPRIPLQLMFIPIPIEARYMMPLLMLMEFFYGVAKTTNIAHWAHLGGALFAALFILYDERKSWR